jgi:hydrogenase maturation protein HypF
MNADTRARCRLLVRGIVQGVGFRPFVYRAATVLGLSGSVRNEPEGVVIEAEGPRHDIESLVEALWTSAPVMAHVESVDPAWLPPAGLSGFAITASRGSTSTTLVPADVATCAACLAELRAPGDRRYRYPFINCTDCGPRYTLIRSMPYDRATTTMASFVQCPACLAEYTDPASRRFHAEPNACPVCGPRLSLLEADGRDAGAADPLAEAARRLRSGAILAVKGLGGFHLACDARDAAAVDRLRRAKERDGKPFAVMSPDIETIRTYARVDPDEAALLASPARPVVLVRKAEGSGLAPGVAPRNAFVGAMLPYAPLHHLLLAEGPFTALVMTSANPHDEPIASGNDEALRRLAGIATAFLVHDRDIVTRCDDSVAMHVAGAPRLVRRSRGHVPLPIALPSGGASVLAVGADLKNAFCVTRGPQAFLGPHVGDLGNVATAGWFEEAALHLCGLLGVRPAVVAHDMHPDYASTRLAIRLRDRLNPDARLVAVQHHHAHALACLVEHGVTGPAIGLVLDGTGYGTDGTIWGGEVLRVDGASFARLAHLRPMPLPGGDRATLEPWRLAVSALHAAGADDRVPAFVARFGVDPACAVAVLGLCRTGRDLPVSSGLGRLFDAVSALCGLCPVASFDGEAAMAVEHVALGAPDATAVQPYPWDLGLDAAGLPEFDPRPLVRALAADLMDHVPPALVCARFQATVVAAFLSTTIAAARTAGLPRVALSGGAFQNRFLLAHLTAGLAAAGLVPLSPSAAPMNDGGIALGQAWAAQIGDRHRFP